MAVGARVGVAVGMGVGSGVQVGLGDGAVTTVGWTLLQAVDISKHANKAMATTRLNNWTPLASNVWLLAIVARVVCEPRKGARGQTLNKAHTYNVEIADPRDYGVSTLSPLP